MKVLFASDHAGFELKGKLIEYVRTLRDAEGQEYDVEDCGAYELDPEDDYPTFITPCAEKLAGLVASGEDSVRAIILGGSGQGEAMAANRVSGIRTAVFYGGDLALVRLAREHNDANILSLGARFVLEEEAKEVVALFLATNFSHNPRHERRIKEF